MGKNPNKCVIRVALNLGRHANNDIVRKCANIYSIVERIKQLPKSLWYGKSVINNLDLKESFRTSVAFLNAPLAYINNEIKIQNF